MAEVAASAKVDKSSHRKGLDAYFGPSKTTSHSMQSAADITPTAVVSHNNGEPIVTPDRLNCNKKLKVGMDQCVLCHNSIDNCHNSKFGHYLYSVGMKMYNDQKEKGDKIDVGMIDRMFSQRYHVLAECDAFNYYDHDTLELEYACGNKRQLPHCVKDGFHFKLMTEILKKEE